MIDIFKNILREELKPIKVQIEENTNILIKSLEHKLNVVSADNEILDDIEYLKYKQYEIEEDLFKLKKNLKTIK